MKNIENILEHWMYIKAVKKQDNTILFAESCERCHAEPENWENEKPFNHFLNLARSKFRFLEEKLTEDWLLQYFQNKKVLTVKIYDNSEGYYHEWQERRKFVSGNFRNEEDSYWLDGGIARIEGKQLVYYLWEKYSQVIKAIDELTDEFQELFEQDKKDEIEWALGVQIRTETNALIGLEILEGLGYETRIEQKPIELNYETEEIFLRTILYYSEVYGIGVANGIECRWVQVDCWNAPTHLNQLPSWEDEMEKAQKMMEDHARYMEREKIRLAKLEEEAVQRESLIAELRANNKPVPKKYLPKKWL